MKDVIDTRLEAPKLKINASDIPEISDRTIKVIDAIYEHLISKSEREKNKKTW